MVKELALPLGMGGIMSLDLDVGKSSSKKTLASPEPATSKDKELKPRTLDFMGWDIDGSTVDTMPQFEDINVEVSTKYFGKYGLAPQEARIEYRADPSAAGTRFMEDLGHFFSATPREIEMAVKEVKRRLSRQRGRAIDHVAEIMAKLKERGKHQFSLTNAYRLGARRKLRHAGLLNQFDVVVGSDSGKLGEVLKKGEPQLRAAADYYISKGLADSYEDFVSRAGYFGDMRRDMEELIPCNLKLLIAFADVATPVHEMIEIGAGLPGNRFQVVTARTIQNVVSIIDLVDRKEIVNFPAPLKYQK